MQRALIKDIIQWDVKNWSEALQFWESRTYWGDTSKRCLELGANRGGLSLWLALKGYEVVCSNLEDTKIRASPLHQKYRVESSIKYEDIDVTNIPYSDAFDIIAFKSVLGGIGNNDQKDKQQRAINEIFKALKPGGMLLFAENLAASRLHKFVREKFVGWGMTWRYITLSEMTEFLSGYSSFEIHAAGVLGAFGRTEAERGLLSSIDQLILNKIVRDNWKYLAYGIAVK